MAVLKIHQIVLLCGCMCLTFGFNKNDIPYDDEDGEFLQKYLNYLQDEPDKWRDYYGVDDDDEEENGASTFISDEELGQFLSQSVSADGEGYGEEEAMPEKDGFDVELRMPNVHPETDDTYFCHVMPMPKEIPVYIVGYDPHANSQTAHHILLYGCKMPGSFDSVWNCGEMAGSSSKSVCMGEQKILYAWALDAPALQLPEDVGFKVGGDSGIDYLVLQVHYKSAEAFKDGSTDTSGISMHMTLERQRLVAGVYFMGADDQIPGHSQVNLEGACQYADKSTLHPFTYRVHTHTLGKVVSAYRIRDKQWEEIGKRDPQLPEMFYPVTHPGLTIEKGDILAMRCTMESDRDRTTYIGSTQDDEMCNFYIMYYTVDDLPRDNSCYVFDFKWADYFKNIPDIEASTLPVNQPQPPEMDMGEAADVEEPVVEEVVVPPKETVGDEEDDEVEEKDENEEVDNEDENEEDAAEDPDPRK